ncbi:RadC family protein [Clostridium cellulovorans]|uniref:DNA repair protein RadC n=1 Tax=Clostridium cellulovorans (strain ATCC 35296 / DSM 3052 / OCM 3 / 743B) TaxID=573061 RepID=D9SS19_CLOC7|nr:DNA repair protein RadC [Clostridium cellulovorans]ADL52466.1 DNA repair protein RadC [Clostridium cellulovorans 743B]
MSQIVKVKDLPENERPRERLLLYGAETLSNSELLAVILGNGSREENAISLSSRIIQKSGGINGLLTQGTEELLAIRGIGRAKCAQIIALTEIAKRFNGFKSGDKYKITCPKDAANLMIKDMSLLSKEVLRIIMLNVKNFVVKIKDVSMGSLNSSIVHPREVFVDAIKEGSASIIICHNHPSGDPTPSKEDINITLRLKEASKIIGIDLLDHIIVGNGTYVSLKEKDVL